MKDHCEVGSISFSELMRKAPMLRELLTDVVTPGARGLVTPWVSRGEGSAPGSGLAAHRCLWSVLREGKGSPGVVDSRLGVTCWKCEPRLRPPRFQHPNNGTSSGYLQVRCGGRAGPGRAHKGRPQAAELEGPVSPGHPACGCLCRNQVLLEGPCQGQE